MAEDKVVNIDEGKINEIKEKIIDTIKEADGVIIFAFKNEENNGMQIPKTMIKDKFGLMAYGNPNFHYAKYKISEIVKEINEQEDIQKAKMSE
jgi:hypothetical protein